MEDELASVASKNPAISNDWEARPGNLDTLRSDDNEVADKIESYEENIGILRQLEFRTKELRDALIRIGEGKYGACEVGSEPIEIERLEANPAATTCVKHMK